MANGEACGCKKKFAGDNRSHDLRLQQSVRRNNRSIDGGWERPQNSILNISARLSAASVNSE